MRIGRIAQGPHSIFGRRTTPESAQPRICRAHRIQCSARWKFNEFLPAALRRPRCPARAGFRIGPAIRDDSSVGSACPADELERAGEADLRSDQDLRSLPDDVRARTTKDIALEIRALPATPGKLELAVYLASRATEGDFGHDTLQEVATTLAGALQQAPPDPQSKTAAAGLWRAGATGPLRTCRGVAGFAALQGSHGRAGSR